MDVTFFTHHYHHDRSFLYGDSKCCVTLFFLFIYNRTYFYSAESVVGQLTWWWKYISCIICHSNRISEWTWRRGCEAASITWICNRDESNFSFSLFCILFESMFFGVGMLLQRITLRQALPFGPFIAVGTFCSLMTIYLLK